MISTLSQLIAQAESSNNLYAVRFEPAFVPESPTVTLCALINKCSVATAKVICATSYGKYQIMGDDLYRRKLCAVPILQWVNDEAAQNAAFAGLCAQKGIAYSLEQVVTNPELRNNFAHYYNGNAAAYGPYLIQVYRGTK